MKKISGIILITLALLIFTFFIYELVTSENELSWFSLILPMIFFFQGYAYLKKEPEVQENGSLKEMPLDISTDKDFDKAKRNSLINKLNNISGEPVIPILEFFDGNYNDQGAIGCNLYPKHPGIEVFRSTLSQLLKRDDVNAIYAHISEIEPDGESWPYSDRIYVFGDISDSELRAKTSKIGPTEIGDRTDLFSPISKEVRELNSKPLNVLWWD